ncbi:MAG: oxygenase MpaB family protein, partial [Candidatus Nanopelagicaceae bacterium]
MRDLSNKWWAKPLANRFRLIVSGSQDGRPDWVSSIAEGDDEGLFGPESAVWKIHGSLATLLGGIRALLLQAAHPAPRNGVIEHSRYESDPLGRLAGTTRWLTLTTFASKDVIAREASR